MASNDCSIGMGGVVHEQVLVREGFLCICAGGGGIPVALELQEGGSQWRRHGVEAVIDKVFPDLP